MRSAIRLGSVLAYGLLLAACATDAAAPATGPRVEQGGPTSSAPPPSRTSPAFERESARTIRECGVRREFNTSGIPNPCEQAKHLRSLFARDAEWKAKHAFTIHAGGIGRCGIRLTVYGSVEAAREAFNGDPLVARITSNDEGFPPDC